MIYLSKCFGFYLRHRCGPRESSYALLQIYRNIETNRKYSSIFNNKLRIECWSEPSNRLHKIRNSRLYHDEGSDLFKYLSDSAPVEIAQKFLVNAHDITGLPWWGSIILTTIMVRSAITLPLAVYQNYIMAKLQNLRLEMPSIVEELKMETAYAMKKFNWTEDQAKLMFKHSLKKQWNNLIIRDNCHPLKSTLLLWIQIPMWVFLSIALRNLTYMLPKQTIDAQIAYNQLSIEGFLWIPNLTDVDHSFILPVALGVLNLAITEIHVMLRINPETKFQKYITNLFRFLSIIMIPISAVVPSALCLYWTTSSVFGIFQNLLLISPKFKRFCKIPETSSEIKNPYEHLLLRIGQKFSAVKSQSK